MKTFVVTGGCGFIGSHLTERLVGKGASVVVIDDLSTGKLSNIESFSSKIDLRKTRAEDFDFHSLKNVDGVFHLAAQASVPLSIENLFESSSTNLLSTLKVIDYCSKKSIPLVYASSSAVYGNMKWGEESGEIELLSPYASDKYMSEVYTKVALDLYGLPSMGMRFFNVYGPRQDPANPYSGVISVFLSRLLRGDSITVNGGHQTRDFVFVGDVVDCLIRSYEYLGNHKVAEVLNVLTGTSISINDLVDTLGSLLGQKPICRYRPLPPGDPEFSEGSTEKMERLLNKPCSDFISFREGLQKTLEWTEVWSDALVPCSS